MIFDEKYYIRGILIVDTHTHTHTPIYIRDTLDDNLDWIRFCDYNFSVCSVLIIIVIISERENNFRTWKN